jgi:error-prone DNA polymerase
MRMGVRVLPPDVNRSEWRCLGGKRRLRIGFQFVKGLSADAAERIVRERETGGAYRSLADLRSRTALPTDDLRLLVKAGACDAIAGELNRPQMLWLLDTTAAETPLRIATAPRIPPLSDYSTDRKRRDAQALLGFCTSVHPMALHATALAHLPVVKSTDLHQHVGRHVIVAGMYATGKPVQTASHEPMQFATFDDGHGLIEAVVFPDVYARRSHVLFDQGPFVLRGKVEESYGAITIMVTHLERLEQIVARTGRRLPNDRRQGLARL